MSPVPLGHENDSSALVGFPAAMSLGSDGHPTRLYVRTTPDQVDAVRAVLPRTTDPSDPAAVAVSRPTDAIASRAAARGAYTNALVALVAVAVIVGARAAVAA